MSRFYFDLMNGHDTLRDEKGVGAIDLDEAMEAVRTVMEEMRDNEEVPAETWHLMIRDEEGVTVKTMSLASSSFDQPTSSALLSLSEGEPFPISSTPCHRQQDS